MAAMTIKIRPMFKLLATLQFIAVVFVFIIGASQSRSASDNFWSINRGDLYNTNPTGRVGIGTTSPNNLLQVRELINFDNSKWNTFLGYQAGDSITTGYFNTAVGYHALYSGAAGIRNTAVGRNALYSNTTGSDNTATGARALFANTTGHYNVANGDLALYANTTGHYNVANGFETLYFNTAGSGNVVEGFQAGFLNTGSNNILIGYQAGYNLAAASGNSLPPVRPGTGAVPMGWATNPSSYTGLVNVIRRAISPQLSVILNPMSPGSGASL